MVWDQTETDLFFRYATQMGLSIPVQAAIHLEGMIEVDDLLESDDNQRYTVFRNLKNTEITMNVAQPKDPPVLIQGISYAIGAR